MKGKKVIVLKVDDIHRIYVYSKKVLYKEKKDGRFVTKVSTPYLSDLLESDMISDDIKKKIRDILRKSSSFFNRG